MQGVSYDPVMAKAGLVQFQAYTPLACLGREDSDTVLKGIVKVDGQYIFVATEGKWEAAMALAGQKKARGVRKEWPQV